jgi:hypothetical protein
LSSGLPVKKQKLTLPPKQHFMKTYTLSEVKDQIIGKVGTPERDLFELEVQIMILKQQVRKIKKEQKSK